MNITFTIFFVLIAFQISGEQKVKNSLDNEYFLIGTLSDYMGRVKYQQMNGRVDRYYPSERKLCLTIDSMFRETWPDLKLTTVKHYITKEVEHELHSVLLTDKMDEFYNFQSSGRLYINADLDARNEMNDSLFSEYLLSADTIFCGRLKTDIFETDNQKLSFITGAFVRFGGTNINICI